MSEEAAAAVGRPRPASTVQRDEQVLAYVQASPVPVTKRQVMDALGLEENKAYLSLSRLRADGRLVRSEPTWTVPA